MPLVQRIAVRLFGKLPIEICDPSTIVALGALQTRCRLRHEDVEEVISRISATRWAWKSANRACGIFSPIIELQYHRSGVKSGNRVLRHAP